MLCAAGNYNSRNDILCMGVYFSWSYLLFDAMIPETGTVIGMGLCVQYWNQFWNNGLHEHVKYIKL